jgi:hypothetical protein
MLETYRTTLTLALIRHFQVQIAFGLEKNIGVSDVCRLPRCFSAEGG